MIERSQRIMRAITQGIIETFTEYKSVTYKTPNGTGTTYGAAGDTSKVAVMTFRSEADLQALKAQQ